MRHGSLVKRRKRIETRRLRFPETLGWRKLERRYLNPHSKKWCRGKVLGHAEWQHGRRPRKLVRKKYRLGEFVCYGFTVRLDVDAPGHVWGAMDGFHASLYDFLAAHGLGCGYLSDYVEANKIWHTRGLISGDPKVLRSAEEAEKAKATVEAWIRKQPTVRAWFLGVPHDVWHVKDVDQLYKSENEAPLIESRH